MIRLRFGRGKKPASRGRSVSVAVPPEVVDRILKATGRGQALRVVARTGGSHHLVLHLRSPECGDFALRIAPGRTRPTLTPRQRTTLATIGVAPRWVRTGSVRISGEAYTYSIFDWIPGRPFDYARDSLRLAETLAVLHRRTRIKPASAVKVDLDSFLRERLRRHARATGRDRILQLLRLETAEALASLKGEKPSRSRLPCLVHADLVAQNILVGGGRAWLIDWDWAMVAHPALDLCAFLSPFVTSWERERYLPDRTVTAFLKRYFRAYPEPEVREISLRLQRCWRAYNCVVAEWLFHEAPQTQPHLRRLAFYRRAFARMRRMEALLAALS